MGGILLVGTLGLIGLYVWRTTENPTVVVQHQPQKDTTEDAQTSPDTESIKKPQAKSELVPSPKSSGESSTEPADEPPLNSSQNDTPTTTAENENTPSEMQLADLIESIEPTVVRLDVNGREGDSIGSGVFVGDEGLIVTNFHVVQGAYKIKVSTADGNSTGALGFFVADPLRDLAVIKIKPDALNIKPIELAAQLPRKGAPVAAFGAPLGFSFTATEGVVSSLRKGEDVQKALKDMAGADIYGLLGYSPETEWIQATAAISGGNSGGPLVDMSGRLIGINTWTVPKAQNLNFACDVNEVQYTLAEAESATLKPFKSLPNERIQIAFSGKRTSDPNGEMTPREKAIRDLVDERNKENLARIIGGEEILEAADSDQFRSSNEAFVSRSFDTNVGTIIRLKVSQDKKYLAALSRKGDVFVFDITQGKLLYQIKSKYKIIRDISFSENPTRLYTIRDQAAKGPQIAIRRPENGSWKTKGIAANGSRQASTLSVSNDGNSIFANWKSSREARFWRFSATGDSSKRFDLTNAFGNGLVFGANGFSQANRVATCSAFTNDGIYLISGFSDGWISACTGAGTKMTNTHSKHAHLGLVKDIAIGESGSKMVSVGEGGKIRLTSLTSKKWSGSDLSNKGGELMGVAISRNEQYIVATRVGNKIEIYNASTKKLIKEHVLGFLATDIEFLVDDRFLAMGAKDGTIRICSVSELMGQ